MSPPLAPQGLFPVTSRNRSSAVSTPPLSALLAFLLRSVEQHHFAAHHHDVEHPLLRALDLPQLALELICRVLTPGACGPEIWITFRYRTRCSGGTVMRTMSISPVMNAVLAAGGATKCSAAAIGAASSTTRTASWSPSCTCGRCVPLRSGDSAGGWRARARPTRTNA